MGCQYSVWQRDIGKKTWHNFDWQERVKGIIIDIAVPADVRLGEKETWT